jgi:hypothetical protein
VRVFNVIFEGMWPVGECLVIAARDESEAAKIAGDTIKHTNEFVIKEVDISQPGVIVYLSGDY